MLTDKFPPAPPGFKRVFARSVWNKRLGKRIYPRNAQFFSFLVKDE